MKRFPLAVLIAACCCALTTPLRPAENAMPASKFDVKKEIVAVIEAQLAAFRKGDATKADSYAAADLRAQKPLPDFTAIVKGNYPEIWANARAEFGIARDDGK